MQSGIEADMAFEDTDVTVNGCANFSIFVLAFLVGWYSSVLLITIMNLTITLYESGFT